MISFYKSKFTRKCIIWLIIVISVYSIAFIIFNITCPRTAIIGRISKDRFGDQIIIYSKAKWLAYKYNIPFLLVPFTKSQKLKLFYKEKHCSKLAYLIYPILYSIFGRYVKVRTENDIINILKKNSKLPTLFISRISTKLHEHIKYNTDYKNTAWFSSLLYELTIQNPNFGKNLKDMLQPTEKIKSFPLPKNKITVAIHIRKGGGFDPKLKSKQYYNASKYNIKYQEIDISQNIHNIKYIIKHSTKTNRKILTTKECSDQLWPEKFPPEQYYVEQIKKLSNILDNKPMYVHIFTDDKNPNQLKKQIQKSVRLPNIDFACNQCETNFLQDIFAMAQFDCLIRSSSGFSYLSQILGNHKIIIYPIHLTWITQDLLIVNKVGIIKRENL